jgi:hypothetical protein
MISITFALKCLLYVLEGTFFLLCFVKHSSVEEQMFVRPLNIVAVGRPAGLPRNHNVYCGLHTRLAQVTVVMSGF